MVVMICGGHDVMTSQFYIVVVMICDGHDVMTSQFYTCGFYDM